MSSFTKLGFVVLRELRVRGLSATYIVSLLVGLALLTAGVVVPWLLNRDSDVEHHVGAVGETGGLLTIVEQRVIAEADPDAEVTFEVTRFDDRNEAETALEAGDVDIVLVDTTTLIQQNNAGLNPSDLARYLQEAAALMLLDTKLQDSATNAIEVLGLISSQPLEMESLLTTSTDEAERMPRTVIAYVGMFLLYFAILTYGSWVLQGVVEEKASRIVEVLLVTLRPWQLLAGKVIGIGLLGLIQFVLYVAWGLVLIRFTDVLELPAVPIGIGLVLLLWFVLGFAAFAVLYAAAGSIVSRMEDAQSAAAPLTVVAIVGFLISFRALENPETMLSKVMTYIPMVNCYVVPIRYALGSIAWWEHALAVVISLGFTVGMTALSARIYNGAILHFGTTMKWLDAWRSADHTPTA